MNYTPTLYFNYYIIALLFMGLGCAERPESKIQTIKIPDRTDSALYLADIAESVKLVPLETNENAQIISILDVKRYKEKLYVADGNKILVFNSGGNFLQTLGKRGDGPGEYRKINTMAIDEESGLIYIASDRKLLVYSSDLNLVQEKLLPIPIQYVSIVNQNPMIVSEKIGVQVADGLANQTNLYELNNLLEITDSIPVRTVFLDKVEVGGYSYKYYLSNNKEGLYLYKPVLTPENILRDTLYHIRDKTLFPFIKLDFERPQSLNERGFQTIILQNIVNSSSYLICEYSQDWERMLFLYDKKNAIGYNLSKGLIDEEGDPVFLRPLDLANDIFYYIKEVEFIDKSIEEENPVIGIVKLK